MQMHLFCERSLNDVGMQPAAAHCATQGRSSTVTSFFCDSSLKDGWAPCGYAAAPRGHRAGAQLRCVGTVRVRSCATQAPCEYAAAPRGYAAAPRGYRAGTQLRHGGTQLHRAGTVCVLREHSSASHVSSATRV